MSEGFVLFSSLVLGILIIIRYLFPSFNVILAQRVEDIIERKKSVEENLLKAKQDYESLNSTFLQISEKSNNWIVSAKEKLAFKRKELEGTYSQKISQLKHSHITKEKVFELQRQQEILDQIVISLASEIYKRNSTINIHSIFDHKH